MIYHSERCGVGGWNFFGNMVTDLTPDAGGLRRQKFFDVSRIFLAAPALPAAHLTAQSLFQRVRTLPWKCLLGQIRRYCRPPYGLLVRFAQLLAGVVPQRSALQQFLQLLALLLDCQLPTP